MDKLPEINYGPDGQLLRPGVAALAGAAAAAAPRRPPVKVGVDFAEGLIKREIVTLVVDGDPPLEISLREPFEEDRLQVLRTMPVAHDLGKGKPVTAETLDRAYAMMEWSADILVILVVDENGEPFLNKNAALKLITKYQTQAKPLMEKAMLMMGLDDEQNDEPSGNPK